MRILSGEFKETRQGIMCVIGAMLMHLSFGYFYTLGNMIPYFISYLDLKKGDEIWIGVGSLALQSVIKPTAGFLCKRFHYRIIICLCFVHSGAITLTYFSIKGGFIPTLLTYSLLSGFYGFVYALVVGLAISWFPQKKGLIGGFVIAGFGASSMIFTQIQRAYINPSNIKRNATTRHFDDPDLQSRIPNIFWICGFTLMGMQILAVLLIRKKNENQIGEKHEQTLGTMDFVKNSKFWLLWGILLTFTCPVTFFITKYKDYGLTMINDDAFMTTVGTCGSAGNMLGRIFWGFVSDRVSFKPALYMVIAVWMLCNLSFPFISYATGHGAKALFFILAVLNWSSIGGLFSLMPTTVAKVFGTENIVLGYGWVYASFGIGSLACGFLARGLHGHHGAIFFGLAGCNLIAAIILAFVPDEKIHPKLDFCKPITDRVWGKKVDLKAGEPTENDAIPTKENNRPEPENLQTE